MARIRTIKPEFPESESVGKLTREARLLFVLLWTLVDDVGRSRASSRFLASRLYPYDDDAADLIDGWLDELRRGGHIRLYEADGSTYLDIPKWLEHQKIDHPAKSRLPEFREGLATSSDVLASNAETFAPHTLDLGPRTKDLGKKDHSVANAPQMPSKRGTRLSDDWALTDDLRIFASDLGLDPDAERDAFVDYWTSVPGSKGLKLDWGKTFKNRCRDLAKKPQRAKTFERQRQEVAATVVGRDDKTQWAARLRGYQPGGFWLEHDWGPPPESGKCRAPSDQITDWQRSLT